MPIFGIILLMSEKQEGQKVSPIRYPSLPKTFSDRPVRRDQRLLQTSNQHKPMPQEVISYMLMKQKFDRLYKNIQKITLKEDQPLVRRERQTYSESPEPSIKAIHLSQRRTDPQICKIRTAQLYPKLSLPDESLEINTVSEVQFRRGSSSMTPANRQVQMMRKSNYKKKIHDGANKTKMSNNIKDYLSVERISIKDMEQSLLYQKSKIIKQHRLSNLLGFKAGNPQNLEQYHSVQIKPEKEETKTKEETKGKHILRRAAKFKPPFQLYYYRDFMWQVAFSNNMIVELVEEYEQKLKIYIGPGNNSNLVKGVIRRRPWWTLTSDIKEANFVWTQIKNPNCFLLQKKGDRLPVLTESEEETPLVKASSGARSTVLNPLQLRKWQHYWRNHMEKERKTKQNLRYRTNLFKMSETSLGKVKQEVRIHNHFLNNFIIGNKKALFKTMNEYYSKLGLEVFDYLPLTFHVKNGLEDDQYLKFLQNYYVFSKAARNDPNCNNKFNAWIVKPGENTNRGNGIIVCLDLNQIKTILKKQEKHNDGTLKTYIIQKYIEKPLLYRKRKFDLRHYMMINCSNGRMKGYWYRDGYVRTTSSEYTLKISNGSVHLTNDAVQKCLPDYGKYEKANKISYEELDQFMKKQDPKFDFESMIYPKMKRIATDVIHASAMNIDPERRVNNFEIFGMDFMIDSNYQVYLIEVNSNPCLETNCPVLNKIIPDFIEHTLQICVDPVFPAPLGFRSKYPKYCQNLHQLNRYELVFDERIDGAQSIGQSVVAGGAEDDEEDVFDDDGQDFEEAL